VYLECLRSQNKEVDMKKEIKILIVCIFLMIAIMGSLYVYSRQKMKLSLENQGPPVTLLETSDFTEDQLNLYNQLQQQGYSTGEALKLSHPEKYEEIKKLYPGFIEALNDTYLFRRPKP
jgi:hypothetical protein